MTSRGFDEEAMEEVGKLIALTLKNVDNEEVAEQVRTRVADLTAKYPMYPNL